MKYFSIEAQVRAMNERDYKILCRLFPYKSTKGEIIDKLFETNPLTSDSDFDYEKNGKMCDWVIEHSRVVIPYLYCISY